MRLSMERKSYLELVSFDNIKDRYEYAKLSNRVGEPTFGYDRIFNQKFYSSPEWKKARKLAIIRDNACDLGVDGYDVSRKITVHHLNPITIADIKNEDWDRLLDLDGLITVSYNTHQAIHFGDDHLLPSQIIERYPGDTVPWR